MLLQQTLCYFFIISWGLHFCVELFNVEIKLKVMSLHFRTKLSKKE